MSSAAARTAFPSACCSRRCSTRTTGRGSTGSPCSSCSVSPGGRARTAARWRATPPSASAWPPRSTRRGRLGLLALALLGASWIYATAPDAKSNAHSVAEYMSAHLRPGDIVLSTQPEQVPVLSYYMSPRLTYANPFGIVHDTGVADWRDGAEHFDRTGVDTQLLPLVNRMRPGQRLLFIRPIVYKPERWKGPWTSRVVARSMEYEGALIGDPRLDLAAIVPTHFRVPGPNPLQGLLFIKKKSG